MSSQRGLVQRIERKLEVSVGDAFARVFGGSIVPQEVEAMLRREAAEGIRPVAGNRLLAPNEYIITLGMHDYQKVGADPDLTSDAFAKHLAGYIGEQGWQTYGDVVVRFEQSANLHTGQFRTRGAVNPDVEPRPTAGELAPPQSDHAFSAEPGVPAMTENSSYGGGQGQGRPGDDYYDDPYAHPHDDPHAAPDPARRVSAGTGRLPRPARLGADPDQGGYPPQYEQAATPTSAAATPTKPATAHPTSAAATPTRAATAYPDQRGGYPDQRAATPTSAAATPTSVAAYPRPAATAARATRRLPPGRLRPARRPGLRRVRRLRPRTGPPRRGRLRRTRPARRLPRAGRRLRPGLRRRRIRPAGLRPAARVRPTGLRPDIRRPGRGGGYAEPGRDYDYGQPAEAGGYGGGYGQGGYSSSGSAVTLQLDDGSGRTYQLREGANVIGRGQDAQFRLPDTGVSRRHLEIRWDGQVALLSDLNSTNGTTVNNAPVQEWQLADGDVIRLGHSEIVVHIH